jgi:hypothetical protein
MGVEFHGLIDFLQFGTFSAILRILQLFSSREKSTM